MGCTCKKQVNVDEKRAALLRNQSTPSDASTSTVGRTKSSPEPTPGPLQSQEDKDAILNLDVRLFKLVKERHRDLLLLACEQVELQAGQVVVNQHDMGDFFFAILDGKADVFVDGEHVGTWTRGNHLGALSLLRPEPRTCSVEAATKLSIARITQKNFRRYGLQNKLQVSRRAAVGFGVATEILTKVPDEKTKEDIKFIGAAIRRNKNLQLLSLDDIRVQQLVDVCWREELDQGTVIMEKGHSAQCFYIVQSGELHAQLETQEPSEPGTHNGSEEDDEVPYTSHSSRSVYIANSIGLADLSNEGPSDHMTMIRKSSFRPCLRDVQSYSEKFVEGDSLGELELLYCIPRAATVRAAEDSVVWAVAKKNFMEILMGVSRERIDENMRYLKDIESFKFLFSYELRELAQALVEIHFSAGDFIIEEGIPASGCHLLLSGEVAILQNGKEKLRIAVGEQELEKTRLTKADEPACCLAILQPTLRRRSACAKHMEVPQIYGEESLSTERPCDCSVRVCSKTASTLMLSRDTLELLIGSLEYLHKTRSKDRLVAVLKRVMMARRFAGAFKKKPRDPANIIHMHEIKRVTILGCGGFGVVELWRHKERADSYAMKIVDKGHVVQVDAKQHILREKNIMTMLDSPFIIHLFETYNIKNKLYFLLELAPGGELDTIYRKRSLFGHTRHAIYYSAGVICAFEHLHRKRIIYRDLKTENVLLDARGHTKLGDFGLAKFTIGKTYTFCGTPVYIAPEIIQHAGHGPAVDWWCLGIFIYELMEGLTPFEHESAGHNSLFENIIKNRPTWPKWAHGPILELLNSLLQFDPSYRLPVRPTGMKRLFEHKWYSDFDWEAFRKGDMVAPYEPQPPQTKFHRLYSFASHHALDGRNSSKHSKNSKDAATKKHLDFDNFNTIIPDRPSVFYKDDGSGWDRNFATAC